MKEWQYYKPTKVTVCDIKRSRLQSLERFDTNFFHSPLEGKTSHNQSCRQGCEQFFELCNIHRICSKSCSWRSFAVRIFLSIVRAEIGGRINLAMVYIQEG